MDKKRSFDLAKKIMEKGDINTGYHIEHNPKSPYITHSTNKDWEDYIKEMEEHYPEAYSQYYDCPGGEMKEYYNKRWKQNMPPKMASYGSSSRFIYESSRDIASFQFEKGLPICFPGIGGKEAEASLDGYLPTKEIFVEAKCHEFYGSHSTEFKDKYAAFYEYLKKKTDGLFQYSVNWNLKEPTVSFVWNNTPITQFDLKQVLCHLLGIAKKTILEKGEKVPTLLYLVYKPSEELLKIVETLDSRRTANSIRNCWKKEMEEFEAIDFAILYKHVVYFLNKEKGIGSNLSEDELERISSRFKYLFCNQHNYKSVLKS